MGDAKEATTRELCQQAKKHYLEIASEAMHTNSLIPRVLDEYPTLTADNQRLRAALERVQKEIHRFKSQYCGSFSGKLAGWAKELEAAAALKQEASDETQKAE